MSKVTIGYNINWEKINSIYKITLVVKSPIEEATLKRLGYNTLNNSYYRKNTLTWSFDEASDFIPECFSNLFCNLQNKNLTKNNTSIKITTGGDIRIPKKHFCKEVPSTYYINAALETLKDFNNDMHPTYIPHKKVKVKNNGKNNRI